MRTKGISVVYLLLGLSEIYAMHEAPIDFNTVDYSQLDNASDRTARNAAHQKIYDQINEEYGQKIRRLNSLDGKNRNEFNQPVPKDYIANRKVDLDVNHRKALKTLMDRSLAAKDRLEEEEKSRVVAAKNEAAKRVAVIEALEGYEAKAKALEPQYKAMLERLEQRLQALDQAIAFEQASITQLITLIEDSTKLEMKLADARKLPKGYKGNLKTGILGKKEQIANLQTKLSENTTEQKVLLQKIQESFTPEKQEEVVAQAEQVVAQAAALPESLEKQLFGQRLLAWLRQLLQTLHLIAADSAVAVDPAIIAKVDEAVEQTQKMFPNS